MDDKFCCYGTYNPKSERCLIKCPFNFSCKLEKYEDEMFGNNEEGCNDGKNNEG